jgi:glutamate dehydrogenase
MRYFPKPLQEKYADFMDGHRLKREIIANQVTNGFVNRMGVSFALRMQEDTGASAAEVVRSYTIAREVFRARDFWRKIEALDYKVDSQVQVEATLAMWNLLRQATRWLLNQPGKQLDIWSSISRLAPGVEVLEKKIRQSLQGEEKSRVLEMVDQLVSRGVPKMLAGRTAILHLLYPALDVVETAASRNTDVTVVANVFFGLGEKLGLKWLRKSVEQLPVEGQWHAHARGNLRDELYAQHRSLAAMVLQGFPDDTNAVERWLEANAGAVERVASMMQDMQGLAEMDYATVSVAVRSLDRLIQVTK